MSDDDGPVRLTVIYPVKDFEQFRKVMQNQPHSDDIVSRRIYQAVDDPLEVMCEMVVTSRDAARQMIRGAGVRDFLDQAGADLYPPVFIGTEVDDLRLERGR